MLEFESFVQNWESHERSLAAARLRVALSRSRHAELMRDLKREFHVAPRSAAVESSIEPSFSPLLPPAVPRRQSYRRYPGRSVDRSTPQAEDNRAKRRSPGS